jgi:hypothetical protein
MNTSRRTILWGLVGLLWLVILVAVVWMAGKRPLKPVLTDLIAAHATITANGIVASLDGHDPRFSESIRERHFHQVAMSSLWISAGRFHGPPICHLYSFIELRRDPHFTNDWTLSRGLVVGGRVFKWGTARHTQIPSAQPLGAANGG